VAGMVQSINTLFQILSPLALAMVKEAFRLEASTSHGTPAGPIEAGRVEQQDGA
jgi:hypothetical protein